MTILILEDEAPAARRVAQFIGQYGWQPAAVVVLPSVAKAAAWLAANPPPDLIFSDIELLDGNVFALYQRVLVGCPVIFTTAYDQFLLPAFQANGIAYLLKPFDYPQFAATLAKYERLQSSLGGPAPAALSPAVLHELSRALQQAAPRYKQRFSVRLGGSLYVLAVEEVAYFQAEEGIVFAVDRAGTRHPLGGTLTDLERQLDPARFFRLNRSEVVHLAFVEKVETYFNNRLAIKLKSSPTQLFTSTGQTPEFRKWLEG